ncbi:TldD/PmbA family protein [Almyronema epifaneia]|uniref:TldD/PmbA family protein n=1 Tax=Almyronema epifaneia S1 TaxID=2991925 RepID=A0ABW6IBF1_9CYAN
MKLMWEALFEQIAADLRSQLQADESFTLTLTAEASQFLRFNQAKVRQSGLVRDGELQLTLIKQQRLGDRSFPLTGEKAVDLDQVQTALSELRAEVPTLPADPHGVLPRGSAVSHEAHQGQLLAPEVVAATLLAPVQALDFVGLYAGGQVIRAYADSAGQTHWFETETFTLDYSCFTADKQAVKGTVAGSHWQAATYQHAIAQTKTLLAKLSQPPKPIQRGSYRTYLAPAAVADLISMFSWGGVSEGAIRRGGSPFSLMRRGEKQLSPKFTLVEDFSHGLVPRFNELGEVAPLQLPIITAGKLQNSLVSSRTAKEYEIDSNYAARGEYLRSPEVRPGDLAEADILTALDTGLYVSNLHYLNWSDRPQGRITGMTRYACFWVEAGEIVAPIQNLRFDESFYRIFGEQLLALTDFQQFIPEVGTYSHRSLGGSCVPGALVEGLTYTL